MESSSNEIKAKANQLIWEMKLNEPDKFEIILNSAATIIELMTITKKAKSRMPFN